MVRTSTHRRTSSSRSRLSGGRREPVPALSEEASCPSCSGPLLREAIGVRASSLMKDGLTLPEALRTIANTLP